MRRITFDHLWPAWHCRIFRNYSGTTFRKGTYWIKKLRFDFLHNFYLKIFSTQVEFIDTYHKRTYVLHLFQTLIKLESSRQIFNKKLPYKIPRTSVQWKPRYSKRTTRRMRRTTTMTTLAVAFSKFANTRKS